MGHLQMDAEDKIDSETEYSDQMWAIFSKWLNNKPNCVGGPNQQQVELNSGQY